MVDRPPSPHPDRRRSGRPRRGSGSAAATNLTDGLLAALLIVSPERKRQVLDDIAQGSVPRPLYYLLLMVSGGIAAFGLIGNSAAVVIGAMLVSPLMTPIFGSRSRCRAATCGYSASR